MNRIAVLGASGYVGAALARQLATHGHDIVAVTRGTVAPPPDLETAICDATEYAALRRAVRNASIVVNCIDARPCDSATIARSLVALLRDDCVGRIVQLSSLAVFGQTRGVLHERSAPVPAAGHVYAAAKLKVERILVADPALSARCFILRLGCVYGPHAPVWVDRLLRLIQAGRLGWLGERGQGACPLIHVNDVAKAVASGIVIEAAGTHHLLSPGRLSWNAYFQLLGRLAGVEPLRHQGALSLAKEVWLTGPLQYGLNQIRPAPRDAITPAMARLFRSKATLVSIRPELMKPDEFVPISVGAAEAVEAFSERSLPAARPRPVRAPNQKILTA